MREEKDHLIQRAARYLVVVEWCRFEQFTVGLGLSEVERGAALALELSAEVGAVESRSRSQREQGSVGGALRHASRLHGVEPSRGRCLTIYHSRPDNKKKDMRRFDPMKLHYATHFAKI